MTRGYEFAKDRYVAFTDDELKALDQEATHGIEVQEFVPLSSVDPSFFERADYLGPGKGGDKAFALFVKTLEEMRIAAIAQYAARGKDYLVLLRPADGRIVMHQLLHADEVRPIDEVPAADADVKPAELKLARDLVSRLAGESFDPARYQDKVRQRIRDLIARKVEGGEVQTEPEAPRAKVVDLMAALKASLEKGATEKQAPREKPAGRGQWRVTGATAHRSNDRSAFRQTERVPSGEARPERRASPKRRARPATGRPARGSARPTRQW
jgi:DNA end-binding protein Ku